MRREESSWFLRCVERSGCGCWAEAVVWSTELAESCSWRFVGGLRIRGVDSWVDWGAVCSLDEGDGVACGGCGEVMS